MSLIENIRKVENFDIYFVTLIPIILHFVSYIVLEPIWHRWGLRDKIAGKTAKLMVDEDNISEKDSLRLLLSVVNRSEGNLQVKCAHICINKKEWKPLNLPQLTLTKDDLLSLSPNESDVYIKTINKDWLLSIRKSKSDIKVIENAVFVITLVGGKELRKKFPERYKKRINELYQQLEK